MSQDQRSTIQAGQGLTGSLELIDTHCHLDYDYAPKTEADLVREAADVGARTLITIGTEMASLPKVAAISDRHPNVYHSVGVHPHEAIHFRLPSEHDIRILREASKHPKCVAIGEIGLDYHYDHSPRDVQKSVLEAQLDLALEVGLPVVIHSREAEEELLQALTRYAERVNDVPSANTSGGPRATSSEIQRSPGVIHCFSGTRAFGEACLKLGFYISFSGIVTFKKADELRECAIAFPLDRILVETDSPYLAPVPFRGKRCEPAMVAKTAEKIAELRGISLEELARATTVNARTLFRLGEKLG